MTHHGSPIIRDLRFEDGDAVWALHERAGFRFGSLDQWTRLWRDNPAFVEAGRRPSMGWVLEASGTIVGYIGNVPLLFKYQGQTLTAATATGFVVDQPFRGHGLLLAARFIQQPNVDLVLITSANQTAAVIYERLKATPLPQPDYNRILFWILRPRNYMTAVFRRARLPGFLASSAGAALSILVKADIIFRRRGPRTNNSTSEIRCLDVSEIDERFDDLFARKVETDTRLMSWRTAEILKWHFSGQRAKVLCAESGERLRGYAVLIRTDSEELGLTRSMVADLFVEGDDPGIVDQLLAAAHRNAMDDGSAVLELMGFPTQIRERALSGRPFSRRTPNMPYLFKILNEELAVSLQNPESWYACPFDGDASI